MIPKSKFGREIYNISPIIIAHDVKDILWKAVPILKIGAKSINKWNGLEPTQYNIGNTGVSNINAVPKSGCCKIIEAGNTAINIGKSNVENFLISKLWSERYLAKDTTTIHLANSDGWKANGSPILIQRCVPAIVLNKNGTETRIKIRA